MRALHLVACCLLGLGLPWQPAVALVARGLLRASTTARRVGADSFRDYDGGFDGYEIFVHEEHPRTRETALRHCEKYGSWSSRHVLAGHTRQSFAAALAFVDAFYAGRGEEASTKPVILDSGCGQGLSTQQLGRANPSVPVIGIDRSINRLSRNVIERVELGGSDKEDEEEEGLGGEEEGKGAEAVAAPFAKSFKSHPNILLVRAEIADFWLLACLQSQWTVQQHTILYPNPYPKGKHLRRRWHGHPCFPVLLALGGSVRVRSNWKTYCDEMHTSIQVCVAAGHFPNYSSLRTGAYTLPPGLPPTTHFERKYLAAGVALHETVCEMPPREPGERHSLLAALAGT